MTGPRQVFTTKLPFFIIASSAAPIMCFVVGSRGTCSERMSQSRRISFSRRKRTFSASSSASVRRFTSK